MLSALVDGIAQPSEHTVPAGFVIVDGAGFGTVDDTYQGAVALGGERHRHAVERPRVSSGIEPLPGADEPLPGYQFDVLAPHAESRIGCFEAERTTDAFVEVVARVGEHRPPPSGKLLGVGPGAVRVLGRSREPDGADRS